MGIKYIKVSPDNPYISMAYKYTNGEYRIPEHRLVMAKHLRRCLTSDDVVHHVNGYTSDNRLRNLILTTRSEHSKLHTRIKNKRISKWKAHRAITVVNAELDRTERE